VLPAGGRCRNKSGEIADTARGLLLRECGHGGTPHGIARVSAGIRGMTYGLRPWWTWTREGLVTVQGCGIWRPHSDAGMAVLEELVKRPTRNLGACSATNRSTGSLGFLRG